MERPFTARRNAAGYSLESAAVRLRLSPDYLRALERGRHPLTPVVAARMIQLYRCSRDQLTQVEEPVPQRYPYQERRQRRRSAAKNE